MTDTKIEWTERTWNPVTGCTKVSPGCDHCYAEGIARRFAGGKAFPNGFDVTLHPERLTVPLRWRKPSTVFVNSMSDLFHADIPDQFIARVFAVMAATPQHTYQVLTKRHGRMRSLLGRPEFVDAVARELWESLDVGTRGGVYLHPDYLDTLSSGSDYPAPAGHRPWPLSNVWLGVSVEDQQRAELRIPALLGTPAAVRFLSCEPLLGPVDLSEWLYHAPGAYTEIGVRCDCGSWMDRDENCPGPKIDWCIVGGESGPGARSMDLDWADTIVRYCQETQTSVFVKQLGSAYGPRKGGDMSMWPADLRVREYPTAAVTS